MGQSEIRQSVLASLCDHLKTRVTIKSIRPVSGGCINSTEILTLGDGRKFFVKSNRDSPELFLPESKGLAAIAATNSIRVPNVIGIGKAQSGAGFLILEVIETGSRKSNFFENFGRALAQMHRRGTANAFGFESDNHIGSTPQINLWNQSWVEFWAEHRLRHQLRLAVKNGFGGSELIRGCEKLIAKLDQEIALPAEPPTLIHGDLWSGNFLISDSGQPVLIDPAVYFGSREAEFGMTTLFGGFSSKFYDAYNEAWALTEGWEQRAEIYKLYHLMNHLNLFGSSYLGGCLDVLGKFA
jgi:fructosamine-3-kinase